MASMKEPIQLYQEPTKPSLEYADGSAEDGGSDSASMHGREAHEMEILSRPILVGYAFGPKKMSTMGVVMAEASKTNLSSVSTTVLVEEADEDEASDQDEREDDRKFTLVCGGNDDEEQDSSAGEQTQQQQQQKEQQSSSLPASGPSVTGAASNGNGNNANANLNPARSSPRRISQDTSNSGNIMLSLDSYSGGLKNIMRYLHSSCSSVDTNSTTTTHLTTGTTLTGVTPSSTSTGKWGGASGKSSTEQQQQRLRVSFVPLDPDLPLEGQHGAKMDIILHKLTEDILCLSKFSPMYPELVSNLGEMNGQLECLLEELRLMLPSDAKGAIMRVHRLMQYQKKHPDCSLADDPAKVLTLMSRSDIAHALADCLVGVTSASGIPVTSPKFIVWQPSTGFDHTESMAQMSYPLIAKPLQAAGTKLSHHMTILLQESSLDRIQNSSCLLQEYINHDAVLYKVYVLGNNVHVYQRPSLPNLPPNFGSQRKHQRPSYVDFDSQRPYPLLSAFGVQDDSKRAPPPYLSSLSPSTTSKSTAVAVTAEEVQPIVDTLKEAFGLELFGFDILIAPDEANNSMKGEKQMLVVDVNYFPSYKEVLNFPSLLAQYLTQRAIDSRRTQQADKAEEGCQL